MTRNKGTWGEVERNNIGKVELSYEQLFPTMQNTVFNFILKKWENQRL